MGHTRETANISILYTDHFHLRIEILDYLIWLALEKFISRLYILGKIKNNKYVHNLSRRREWYSIPINTHLT